MSASAAELALHRSAPVTDGVLPVDPPLRVDDAEKARWDARCDVLVVGFGAAGAAAAITAKEGGAHVVIADRFEGGGATTKSGGVVYAGGGTPHQRNAGYEDTPDAMFRYLRQETGDAVSEPTLRRFCEDSRGLIEWLESIGCDFRSSEPPPKTSYPKDGIYLYYSGNEAVPAYAEHAPPAPRGHRTRGSWMSGKVLFELLRKRAAQLEIPVMAQSAVRRLIVDADGAVVGAEVWQLEPGSEAARRHQKLMRRAEAVHNIAQNWADRLRAQALALELAEAKPMRVRTARGVVLAAGGFIFNREMVARYAPKYAQTMRLGATGCDGSGIRLGQTVGGVAARMNTVSAWRFINPPTAWPKGIVVDQQGRRFCNEQVYGARLGVEMCEDHGGRGWLILDRALRRTAMREALFGGLWFFQSVPAFFLMLFAPRAKTLDALATKIGMPADALRASVEDYNAAIDEQRADPLGKADAMRAPLKDAPYYAFDISANSTTFPCPAITLGGLRVDETSGAVLDERGQPIAGLYAAGRNAVGVASNRYVSGLSLADCLWSGRRAGRQLAAVTAGKSHTA
ncbi:FAD-binding protein [Fontimonas sp. SYSU GA230001]|uniref:FAD-binding protein n=1 Tax=Fontimonas sp. SYSU GA230001 TaxID=3142450 RepID=UPI0032B412E7